MKRFLLLIFLPSTLLLGEIIYESGRLMDFIGGQSPSTAYDNWISHVTEGIADSGYNDYGPDWLDVQSNGFGNYTPIQENSSTLFYIENILSAFIALDTSLVDELLSDSLSSFQYEIVIFEDTLYSRTYYMLREILDSSFVDLNIVDDPDDDVSGSFVNGWGLYIIDPNSPRPQLAYQVPHPCDDFIAPYVATELYQQTHAYALMIAGAGREVLWTGDGSYSNNKSLADPARNENTFFHIFHRILSDDIIQDNQFHSPIFFHIHSFDNQSHAERNSVILAAGSNEIYTNKPIRDVTDSHFDIINFTEEFTIPVNAFGNHSFVHASDYYEAYYSGEFFYEGVSENYPIVKAIELRGPSHGVQMIYLQNQFHPGSVYEPWVHVELDEKPHLFDDLDMSNELFYSFDLNPTTWNNYSLTLEYYQPFIDGMNTYFTHWESNHDTTAPSFIENLYPSSMTPNHISLQWDPVDDTNFKSYEIMYDRDSLTQSSPIWNNTHDDDLTDMRTTSTTISGINHTDTWVFQIRAIDHFGNTGDWSTTTQNILPGHHIADTLVSFSNNDLLLYSFSGEDIDQTFWALDTVRALPGSPTSLHLYGNTWKWVEINPFLPDSSTIIQVSTFVDSVPEIQAIGFKNNDHTLYYSLSGNLQLDIEQWVTTYQGSLPIRQWSSYQLPLGLDWLSFFDSLSPITGIIFINNQDLGRPGSIYFSDVLDITPNLGIPPTVTAEYNLGDSFSRNRQRIQSVQFTSTIQDTDSYSHDYYWDFGDGYSSTLAHPSHEYNISDDHQYSVLLTVQDETGLIGQAPLSVPIEEGETSYPLTINFVGDIMMGRAFEAEDGIIPTQGVYALFEPTLHLLNGAADVSVANLEIPLTNQGEPHPTKGISFRCAPENVSGLVYAGIDVVSLANNHILDYMEPGLIQTTNILTAANIRHSGAGLSSYEAYLPATISRKGQTIAFLSSSDRTGQYNNAQPYLNAGTNKAGFAYMTPFYLRQQIDAVDSFADLIVVEMHAGSEYSSGPGNDYDLLTRNDLYAQMLTYPTSQWGNLELPNHENTDEDYSPRLDVPHMWDREIRQFAIDEGADLVVVHHPHILQGIEVYNEKVIAHSLGNFIFDLDYPETYPTIILNAMADGNGFNEFTLTPIYIDDYIPVPAVGELALHILDNIAKKSRDLDSYVFVDRENGLGEIILNPTANESYSIDSRIPFSLAQQNDSWMSAPISLARAGNLSTIEHITELSDLEFRVGKNLVWMGNFENEGSTLWNINSSDEFIDNSQSRLGSQSLHHIRNWDDPEIIITNLEEALPLNPEKSFSMAGYIKTNNGSNVKLQSRFWDNRFQSPIQTLSMTNSINGTHDSQYYWQNMELPENVKYFNLRAYSGLPETDIGYSWFDQLSFIEWDEWQSASSLPLDFQNPNDYYFIQIRTSGEQLNGVIDLVETAYGNPGNLISIPKSNIYSGEHPLTVHFSDESIGPSAK
ncbi:MAG: hypothetical protein HN514_03465 [Candidatus Marinimicrobia bacterium]|nr:hypothetical protein [Candidatus Neomarinimicrobiota bacterium]